jgi:hypothetical protein
MRYIALTILATTISGCQAEAPDPLDPAEEPGEGKADALDDALADDAQFALLRSQIEESNLFEGAIDIGPSLLRSLETRMFEVSSSRKLPFPRTNVELMLFVPGRVHTPQAAMFEQLLVELPRFAPLDGEGQEFGASLHEYAYTEHWGTWIDDPADRAELVAAFDEHSASGGGVRMVFFRDVNRHLAFRHQTTGETVTDDRYCFEKLTYRYKVIFASIPGSQPLPPEIEGRMFEFENLTLTQAVTPFTMQTRLTEDLNECSRWLDEE